MMRAMLNSINFILPPSSFLLPTSSFRVRPPSRSGFCLALERLQHVEQSAALGLARQDARAAFVQRAQGAVESLVADLAREADRNRVVARRRLEVFERRS